MKAAELLKQEPTCKVIGPQIGPVFGPCGVRITIAFPHRADLQMVACRLCDSARTPVKEIKSGWISPRWKNFMFEFTGLSAGQRYSYNFYDTDGNELDLGEGLDASDCHFLAPEFNVEDRMVLLSCNNPFYSGGSKEQRFAMWERLFSIISSPDGENIKLLIQGGDQVYHDDIEKTCLSLLSSETIDEDAITAEVVRIYQHFYGPSHYRKILARIPSVAMLDDHDITDGWGGRPESYDEKSSVRSEWQGYFDRTYDAFKAYQTIKNPVERVFDEVETTYLDFGNNRLYLLDLRKEKNVRKSDGPLVSGEHEQSLLASIGSLPRSVKNLFVLSPVVPVRIDPQQEEMLAALSSSLYDLRKKAREEIQKGKIQLSSWALAFWRFFYWIGGKGDIDTLTDDLTDALSSKINRKFLVGLTSQLAETARTSDIRPIFLSGDIHCGGISEIFVRYQNGSSVCIPQIVSSPMGYEPMSTYVKNSTTEEFDYEIKIDLPEGEATPAYEIAARNIFYRSDRNFCLIKPNGPGSSPTIEFHFEKLKEPVRTKVPFC